MAFGDPEFAIRGQEEEGGGGLLGSDATNPTSDLTVFRIQNVFVPSIDWTLPSRDTGTS